MTRGILILALVVVIGCATSGKTPPPATIHPLFADLRPVEVEVMMQTTSGIGDALDSAVRQELLDRNYSPLAPGATRTDETGLMLVVATVERAQVSFTTADGKTLYRMETSEHLEDAPALAKTLLLSLPAK
jgi:hypothetical protein